MASMKDISEVCGVSIATVSKALNDHADIGTATKERIRKVAKEMGYSPNSAAKALKTRRSYNIGILFVDEANNGLTHEHFSSILNYFKQTVEKQGFDITFINKGDSGASKMSYLEHARYRGFDGVFIACIDFDNPEVQELAASDIPIVTVDYPFPNHPAVISNDEKGISDLLKYIYKKGHRKIAYLHGGPCLVTDNRLGAFRKTARKLKLELPDAYLQRSDYRSTSQAKKMTTKLLELPDPPTCILYPDDFAALGGLDAIAAKGLRVPEDISIVGYDGIRISRHLTPHLTTLQQDVQTLGKMAAEQLIRQIEDPPKGEPEHTTVNGKVYEGGSVSELT